MADGAASPDRLGRGASPSFLAATGRSTQHLSQSRGARSCCACVLRAQVVSLWRCLLASPSATRRKQTEKRKTLGAGGRKAAKSSEERDAHRPREDRSKARARWPSLEIISIKTCLRSRTYCCRKFLESEIIAEGVGYFSPKPNSIRTATAERRKAKSPTSDAIS